MQRVGVIDYGAGNIASVMKAVEYAGADAVLVSDADDIKHYDRFILPGVGASGRAIAKLRERNLDKALDEAVRKQGKPLLGICVGMQLLAEDMYEYGHHKGLGWIPGKVISLQELGVQNNPVPHMGWSDVKFGAQVQSLAKKLGNYKALYFAHSYTLVTDDKDKICATVDYEREMVAGVMFGSVAAFQPHPEKSQVAGDILLQWFLGWDHA